MDEQKNDYESTFTIKVPWKKHTADESPQDLVKMQILMQKVWGGAWESEF